MSLTADTADAIIAVDTTMATFLREFGHIVKDYPEWTDLKDAIEGLQETACGEGVHFDSLEEARAYRSNSGPSLPEGNRWCVGACGNSIPVAQGFRCGPCSSFC